MRTEKSLPEDLALNVSANQDGATFAFLHGCTPEIVAQLKEWLEHTKSSAGHPMLLPALLAETQYAKHDRIQHRYNNNFLRLFDKIELLARNLSKSPRQNANTFNKSARRHSRSVQTAPGKVRLQQWEEERKREAKEREERKFDIGNLLNRVFSLYQKNGNLQRHLTSFRAQLTVMVKSIERIEKEALPTQRPYLHSHGERIKERLDEICSDYENLIKQSTLKVEGANLLLTSVGASTFSI